MLWVISRGGATACVTLEPWQLYERKNIYFLLPGIVDFKKGDFFARLSLHQSVVVVDDFLDSANSYQRESLRMFRPRLAYAAMLSQTTP